jgi:hypothetical protein
MDAFLKQFGRNLALRAFGVGGATVTIEPSLNGNFTPLRQGLAATNTTIHGRTGIVVAMTRGPSRTIELNQPVAGMLGSASGQTARIRGNRNSGFAQGIRVAASDASARKAYMFAESADIENNLIALRLPWQARQRGGVWVGNCLGVRVNGNRIVDHAYQPLSDGEASIGLDSDGIRLWGFYGPLVEARGNLMHGTSVGIRWHPIGRAEPTWGRPDIFARAFADNAYSGMGSATDPAVIP